MVTDSSGLNDAAETTVSVVEDYHADFEGDIDGNIINDNLHYDYIEYQGFAPNVEGEIQGSTLVHLSKLIPSIFLDNSNKPLFPNNEK